MSIVRMTARKKSEKASRRFALSGNVQHCDALQKLVLKTFDENYSKQLSCFGSFELNRLDSFVDNKEK